jgi:hypothetical protein
MARPRIPWTSRLAIFETAEEAARAALKYANPRSIDECLEYGGLIYRNEQGRFGFSGPMSGTGTGCDPSNATIPAGTELVGDYHTHGAYCRYDSGSGQLVRTDDPAQDDYNSDEFSDEDIAGIAAPVYRGLQRIPGNAWRRHAAIRSRHGGGITALNRCLSPYVSTKAQDRTAHGKCH